jgi:hypothetical protein
MFALGGGLTSVLERAAPGKSGRWLGPVGMVFCAEYARKIFGLRRRRAMTAERHADAVRSYLDYLCDCPEPGSATPWPDWARRTMGATAMVGLSLGAGACGGDTFEDGGQAGAVAGGGIVSNGGTAYGITGGRATGGVVGTGNIGPVYGMPMGGTGSGGRATGGVVSNGGTAYGMPSGGRATGGIVSNGGTAYAMPSGGRATGGIIGTGNIGADYGVPFGGSGVGGQATGGSGLTAGAGARYAIPIGGASATVYGVPTGGV